MREIKFRAWSKVANMFLDITGFETEKGRVYGLFHDGDYIGYDKEDIHLMQYTGLNDENGKEIYEGDILKFNTDAPGVVDYFRGSWRVKTPPKYRGDDWRTSLWDATVDGYEIIGNIYKNPELLETK